MDLNTLKQHMLDFLKGLAAAVLSAALLTGLNYLSAHLPQLLQLGTSGAAAIIAIKTTRA